MARKGGFKYPRLTILTIVIVLTFFIFSTQEITLANYLQIEGMFGAFIAGLLYAFSFTAFISTALFINMAKSSDILLLGVIGGLGSVIADLIILKTARFSFNNEFKLLYKEPFFKRLSKPFPPLFLHTLKVIIALVIIASPLPDEAGVTLLANGFLIPRPLFIALSFCLNTAGIFTILYIGQLLL